MPRGRKPFLTPEQDKDVADRYLKGATINEIASVYGLSVTPIAGSLRRSGVERRVFADYTWQDTPENRAEVVRLFRDGLGVQSISKRVGTRNETVSHVLRESGIQARFGGQNRRFKGEQVKSLVAAYATGLTIAELARRNGCSGVVIRNTLKREGVEIRPFGHTPKFWTPERCEWLQQQWESGRSQSDIARELGYSQANIGRKLRDLGIALATPQAKGAAHGSWKGGRTLDGQGYIRVRASDDDKMMTGNTIAGGYVLEHRLVIARALGRPLKRTETVHHVNGDKTDNRLENLQLRQGNHGTGVVVRCLDCGSANVAAVPLD